MYLSKLEILGFKSFAQKTKLKFSDGICCVIGPNGSGKSNIVDAIRWVLGEQKISSLRTDKMESLIFNGTSTRKPLGMTEVSLTVHNNKNVLKSTFTDVVISRRLYRSGESHYLINKAPCRLKDIQDLFMDTGMGANSYSVIELKMVENIISESPADRRHLFEEAAGVTKYKNRRKSALRKLDLTRQDMSRISDLIAEINRTVTSLSRQVGKARRYLKYQEELKQKEIELAKFRYTHLLDEINPLQKQLNEISVIKNDTTHQITIEEALLEDYKREIIQIENNLTEISQQIYDQDNLIHEIKADTAVAEAKIQSLNETERRYRQDIEEYQEKSKNLKINVGEYQEKFNGLAKSLSDIRLLYQEKEEAYQAEEKILSEDKLQLDKFDKELKILQQEVSSQKAAVQEKEYQIKMIETQITDYLGEEQKTDKKEKEINLKLESMGQNKNKIEKQTEEIASKINSAQNSLNQIDTQIEQQKEEILHIQAQKEAKIARIQFFEQIISNYEGYAQSTRDILLKRQDFPGLHGPLSDLITVNEENRVSVESALGDATNYLVVDDVNAAKNVLKYITEGNRGRVTLLPLNRLNTLSVDDDNSYSHLTILSDLISCEHKYQKIFQILLGDIALVENLDQALEESRKHPHMRFVTPNGEMLNLNKGTITGGKPMGSKASLIGRSEQLLKLKAELEAIENNSENAQKEIEDLSKKREMKSQEVENLEKNKNQLLLQLTEIDKKESQIRFEKHTLDEAALDRNNTIKKTRESIKSHELVLQEIRATLSQKLENLDKAEKDVSIITENYDRKNNAFQDLSQELQQLNLQLVTEQNHYNNTQASIERVEKELGDLEYLINRRNNEIEEIHKQLEQIDLEKEKRKKNQTLIWDKRDKFEADKEKIQQEYHELRDKILQLENQIKKYRKQHDSSLERSRQLELNIQENQMKANAILDRIKEDYNEDISLGITYDGLDIDAAEQQIESLKDRIKLMGQVNPLAVSEYEKERERLEFYTNQFNDLEEAEKSLRRTINKINITARKRFNQTFESIKSNFERVFNNFFESGEGTLKLEEDADPLESNIEILVRPKGKRLQTINLLSGGEKTLTAISLLFAIYLVKPSPFCILDEIDAPLDDVNISRFTQALLDFSKDTQFIVVTHNKRTMESADTMFGITMEEEGLSKIVSVKFN